MARKVVILIECIVLFLVSNQVHLQPGDRAEVGRLPASFACFPVSALMHELIFYYIGRKEPRWVVTSFFLLHGLYVAAEIAAKKALAGRFRLPRAVTGAMAVGFILATALWLFQPALLWCDAEDKARRETTTVVDFVKRTWSVVGYSSIMKASR